MRYSEAELKAILGEPTHEGHVPGDGSYGSIKPWWPHSGLNELPAGPHRYMVWDCLDNNAVGECCVAVSVAKDGSLRDSWQVLSACNRHAGLLVISPFAPEDIFSFADVPSRGRVGIVASTDRPRIEYEVVVISSTSYIKKQGPEWDALASKLRNGYVIPIVYADRRIPGFHIVVLQR